MDWEDVSVKLTVVVSLLSRQAVDGVLMHAGGGLVGIVVVDSLLCRAGCNLGPSLGYLFSTNTEY